MTLDGRPMGGWVMYSLQPTNAAWLGFLFYQHWRYTMDEAFLRDRAYPWCAEIGQCLLSLLKPDADGVLRLPLSSSPEIHDNTLRAWLRAQQQLRSRLHGGACSAPWPRWPTPWPSRTIRRGGGQPWPDLASGPSIRKPTA